VVKWVCFRGFIGEDCVNCRCSLHAVSLALNDLLTAGDDRSRFLEGPELGRS
jgi:hypothetical protein